MTESSRTIVQEIPMDRLPPGFANELESPPESPAKPRPAATVALFREETSQLQVLLLRRVRSAGFVPGAYVFPGGRVDSADAHPGLLPHLDGADPDKLARRLKINGDGPSAFAYLVAAFREAFEETGILPGLDASVSASRLQRLRLALLENELTFLQILEELNVTLNAEAVSYIAHWVTPEAEPRRYDTRFFAMEVHGSAPVSPQHDEVSQALWITPLDALRQHQEGQLPMVFPTVRTLEELSAFSSATELRQHYRSRRIPRILPRLVRTPTGVGISIPDTVRPTDDETP